MPSATPWSYVLIRLLFRFVLKIFYGTIVVEGASNVPKTGKPCIVCANHSNSLTDALMLVTTIPPKERNFIRLTAKATQFGKRTFTSWLIESAGTVPIRRKKDYAEGESVDNTDTMDKLIQALEMGDAVCLFPEGMSRYHPSVAPLKTGVARMISDILTRNRNNPTFEISLLNCSVTYMHREHFRSDVLVTFHPPMVFTPKTHPELLEPVEFSNVRALTAQMSEQITSGTFDSPSWDLVRVSKLAARMYAPLGTRMTLGDYVRVVRTFLEAFKAGEPVSGSDDVHTVDDEKVSAETSDLARLREDLRAYQDELARLGIKDDRIRRRPLPRLTIIGRMILRITWAICLFSLSLPGLVLWAPVFITIVYAVHNFKKTGPIFDTFDEIAQYKLVYGLVSGLCVWFGATAATFPFSVVTFMLVPALMWMTLRWFEDAVSALRAFMALGRLLLVGPTTLRKMYWKRDALYDRVMKLAIDTLALPNNPEVYFIRHGGREKGRVRGRWESGSRYFSIKRRRKRDWNESLRLYDIVDYPEDDS
ncbi:PlsC domain-containing protein [Mycena indigotica]|uniref:PlsC domain-containing protein n=1 Tax=Mycena indigotica TaxID=2126181 RepID=A0A8H6TDT8_9AGAR|nr:PlsC domain-containing protein [Mycena indigotica]KAF7315454.1 PlsC domain-containing protein [Mycena indigotica]